MQLLNFMFFLCTGDVTKQADLSKFYRNLLDRNVSSGGAFDTEQQTEPHEENTKKSRRSPSPEMKERNIKKGERKERTSENERKRSDYKEGKILFIFEVRIPIP